MKWFRAAAPVAAAVILALVPLVHVAVPAVMPGPLSAPGTLQLLAVCLVFGALALSYDPLFGFTGRKGCVGGLESLM